MCKNSFKMFYYGKILENYYRVDLLVVSQGWPPAEGTSGQAIQKQYQANSTSYVNLDGFFSPFKTIGFL